MEKVDAKRNVTPDVYGDIGARDIHLKVDTEGATGVLYSI